MKETEIQFDADDLIHAVEEVRDHTDKPRTVARPGSGSGAGGNRCRAAL